jgi:hypothetical protein
MSTKKVLEKLTEVRKLLREALRLDESNNQDGNTTPQTRMATEALWALYSLDRLKQKEEATRETGVDEYPYGEEMNP